MVIGLTGRKGSGKNMACANLPLAAFKPMSFAEPLKSLCKDVFGLEDCDIESRELKEKTLTKWPHVSPRILMQHVGTDLFRKNYPEVWVEHLKRRIFEQGNNGHIIVTDVRFKNEAEMIYRVGGQIIRIVRPGHEYEVGVDPHSSETEMDDIDAVKTIKNDGTIQLLQARLHAAILELLERK
jgi:hypothetical protein